LYDERLTIAGAKRRLQMVKKQTMTDKKKSKMIKSSTYKKESDGQVVRTVDNPSFEKLGDHKELLFDIRKELKLLRSRISG
jgi:hypothetical protein